MKKYEILFNDRHTEIVDHETMENLVYELESFERTDVSQIHEYDESNPDEIGETIWTEEEGLFISYGELNDEDLDDKDSNIRRLVSRFNQELDGWDYESWTSSGSGDREEIVRNLLPEFTSVFDEETIYDLFYDWSDGLCPEDFE
jgi:hypothetical protein